MFICWIIGWKTERTGKTKIKRNGLTGKCTSFLKSEYEFIQKEQELITNNGAIFTSTKEIEVVKLFQKNFHFNLHQPHLTVTFNSFCVLSNNQIRHHYTKEVCVKQLQKSN